MWIGFGCIYFIQFLPWPFNFAVLALLISTFFVGCALVLWGERMKHRPDSRKSNT